MKLRQIRKKAYARSHCENLVSLRLEEDLVEDLRRLLKPKNSIHFSYLVSQVLEKESRRLLKMSKREVAAERLRIELVQKDLDELRSKKRVFDGLTQSFTTLPIQLEGEAV